MHTIEIQGCERYRPQPFTLYNETAHRKLAGVTWVLYDLCGGCSADSGARARYPRAGLTAINGKARSRFSGISRARAVELLSATCIRCFSPQRQQDTKRKRITNYQYRITNSEGRACPGLTSTFDILCSIFGITFFVPLWLINCELTTPNDHRCQSLAPFTNLCCTMTPTAVGTISTVGRNHLRVNTHDSTCTVVFG